MTSEGIATLLAGEHGAVRISTAYTSKHQRTGRVGRQAPAARDPGQTIAVPRTINPGEKVGNINTRSATGFVAVVPGVRLLRRYCRLVVRTRKFVSSVLNQQPLILWADLPIRIGCFCRDLTASARSIVNSDAARPDCEADR